MTRRARDNEDNPFAAVSGPQFPQLLILAPQLPHITGGWIAAVQRVLHAGALIR